MCSPLKLVRHISPRRRTCPTALPLWTFLALCWLQPTVAHAQGIPPGAVARLEGSDTSVEGGAVAQAAGVAPNYIFNGGILTVHAGKAKLTFIAGGEVYICGPAKLTVLQSAGSITLALDFGRLRMQLPAGSPIRVFTPTVIATPIDIGGADRDITLGLDMNDSLCVLASSGALRLEQQFTGEGLIVPQAGEFFIAPGKFVPTAGATGSCDCTPMAAQSAPPPNIPLTGVSSASQLQMPAPAPTQPEPSAAKPAPAEDPHVQLRVLAKENEIHPLPQPEKNAPPPAPPTAIPEYKAIVPPLVFSATSPTPPEDPSMDAVILVRTVHVEPEYEFSGHVDPPSLASNNGNSGSSSASQPRAKQTKEKNSGGFWSHFKRLFGGS